MKSSGILEKLDTERFETKELKVCIRTYQQHSTPYKYKKLDLYSVVTVPKIALVEKYERLRLVLTPVNQEKRQVRVFVLLNAARYLLH